MALKYRAPNGTTYTLESVSFTNAKLYEKRIMLKNASGTTRYAFFERDDWPVAPNSCPPTGNRLKISDGTHSYRGLTDIEVLKGTFGGGAYTGATILVRTDAWSSGTWADWSMVEEFTISVDRRAQWTDFTYNFAWWIRSTILFAGNLWFKLILTWEDNTGSTNTTTLAPDYNPIWPARYERSPGQPEMQARIYPKPGTTVNVKLYVKGSMGNNQNFNLYYLAP